VRTSSIRNCLFAFAILAPLTAVAQPLAPDAGNAGRDKGLRLLESERLATLYSQRGRASVGGRDERVIAPPQRFKTAEEAVDALATAARIGEWYAMIEVLGLEGADILSSGDAVDDVTTRERLLAAYDASHKIAPRGLNEAILMLGPGNFPFPIPLVRERGTWQFDTHAGRQEILFRRIGRNELETIRACLAYVAAQKEYAKKDRTGVSAGVYAQRLLSRPGTKDGLYWPAAQDGDRSPIGKLVARAADEGYRLDEGRAPYHGYYFRVLTKQGSGARGGALDYVVDGKMVRGFALVAYPVEYGNSGVMTFLVNHDGKVYQNDLGPRTFVQAARLTSFDPGNWKQVAATETELQK